MADLIKSRFRTLSKTGFSLVVMAFVFTTFVSLAIAQLFSPGKLGKAHKHLEGVSNCKKCHSTNREIDAKLCLSCHKPLNKRIKAKKGYHGRMKPSKLKNCETCHIEHKGRNFKVVYWPKGMKSFDHKLTGYVLKGKHKDISTDCRKCHKPSFVKDAQVRAFKRKNNQLSKTFMGLPESCNACHSDPHRGQVSKQCSKCHTETSWKPASKFDHAKTRFPLKNKHKNVDCIKCHKPLPGRRAKGAYHYKISTNCSSCHKDIHDGKMTKKCERCHSDSGWMPIQFDLASHAPKRFPLTGQHAKTSCRSCHGVKAKKTVRPACISCHKTPHPPSFSKRCQSCHNTKSWLGIDFTREQHQKTRFPLIGKHMEVACTKCHRPKKNAGKRSKKKGRKHTRFRMKKSEFEACTPCHKDVHQGQFKNRKAGNKCTSCHNEHGFKPPLFGLAEHAKCNFQLKGAHLAVPCAKCHTKPKGKPNAPVQYKLAHKNCRSCHTDPHKGQYDPVIKVKGCVGCHVEDTWTKIHDFKHDLTKFKLTGAHNKLACAKCHPFRPRKDGEILPLYKGRPTKCSGCHSDPHYGQFQKGKLGPECSNCHTTTKWAKAKLFNHDRANFKLTGAHVKVKCVKCHAPQLLPNQKKIVKYRPLKHKQCSDCHVNFHRRGKK